LKDDFSEVRLNILSQLSNIKGIMQNNTVTPIVLNALDQLTSEKNWRTRLQAVELLSIISSEMGINLFKDSRLADLCFSLLGDNVLAIRTAGIENLKSLAHIFGIEWAKENIIPRIRDLSKQPNYTFRMTTLKTILKLADLFSPEEIVTILLPIVIELSSDRVPNIRFNVCKTLETLATLLDQDTINSQILPTLINLQQDKDKDVSDFAVKALNQCKQ